MAVVAGIPLVAIIASFAASTVLPALTPPLVDLIRQQAYRTLPTVLPPESTIIVARHRKLISDDEFYSLMQRLGYSRERADILWHTSFFYPTPSDLVSWQAREVFEEDAVRKYGLDAEFERIRKEPFYRAGMDDEQIRNYWRAHWQHASWTQVAEMLHRNQLTKDEVWEWFRLVEIPPYWRDKFIAVSYSPYTRVDVRRMWDMRTIDESELMRTYLDLGYDEEHATNMVIWTKVYTAFPDLIARFRNGWITSDQVLDELIQMGMPANRAKELLETKIKTPVKAERLAKERDLTKTEILKGLKLGKLSQAQATALLERLGYDRAEASFIVEITMATEGSPETPLDFRALVERYREAAAMEAKPIPKDVLEAEREFYDADRQLREAIERRRPQDELDRLTRKRVVAFERFRILLRKYQLEFTED